MIFLTNVLRVHKHFYDLKSMPANAEQVHLKYGGCIQELQCNQVIQSAFYNTTITTYIWDNSVYHDNAVIHKMRDKQLNV